MRAYDRHQRAAILPRFIRFRDAPIYLGMDKDRFNSEVRPYVAEIPIGKQGVAFDRLDLDAWADQYRSRVARPGLQVQHDLKRPGGRIASNNSSTQSGASPEDAVAFTRALAAVISKKRKPCSAAAGAAVKEVV